MNIVNNPMNENYNVVELGKIVVSTIYSILGEKNKMSENKKKN